MNPVPAFTGTPRRVPLFPIALPRLFPLAVALAVSGLFGCRTAAPPMGMAHNVRLPVNSELIAFSRVGDSGTPMSRVNVVISALDDGEAIQGATVVVQRADGESHFGRITDEQGRCAFLLPADGYVMRVQFTGLKTFTQSAFEFRPGMEYSLVIGMAPERSAGPGQLPARGQKLAGGDPSAAVNTASNR